MTFSRFLYTVIFYLLSPVIVLRLLYRALKAPAYARRWSERFGFVDVPSSQDIIWLHAVSVGETLAAIPLVKSLQHSYPNSSPSPSPSYSLMVTCMTPTGSERIKAAFGDSVDHSYAPYDMPDAVARFLNRVKPKVLIIMETELCPQYSSDLGQWATVGKVCSRLWQNPIANWPHAAIYVCCCGSAWR